MRTILSLAALAVIAGCVTSEGPDCGTGAPVAGTWELHGVQVAPVPGGTFVGTLTVGAANGCSFNGDVSIELTPNGGGGTLSLTGPLDGTSVNDSLVNFDVQFPDRTAWTHIGKVTGDSLSGDWYEGVGPSAPHGTFWAKRAAP